MSLYTFTARISGIQIRNKSDDVINTSNRLYFKTGSNYLDLLSDPNNATPMISTEIGDIESNQNGLDSIWASQNMCKFENWWKQFETSFEFKTTPPETSNAKLFLRFNDEKSDQVLEHFNVMLEYWGGAKYYLIQDANLFKTQDLLLNVPNGKYIQKIYVWSDTMYMLGNCSIGMIHLFNNVDDSLTFVQYPAIYGTSGDGSLFITKNNVPRIDLNYSGYVMLSGNGAYILPGTNVIRKQKLEPTINDDPALQDGDVWFDISAEPLVAYQRKQGKWVKFYDIPIGYVTLGLTDPTASATKESETILTVSCNAFTFQTQTTTSGTYEFSYDTDSWYLGENVVDLEDYGIVYTGTATTGDTITVTYDNGHETVTNIEQYPINQNGYNINAFTENIASLSGKDGRDGQNGKDGKNGADGPQGPAGIGIPTGGLTGQILAKASNANYVTKWTNVVSNALFDGGNAGQTLIKNSNEDLDFSWGNVEVLPMGGTTGQALVKTSDADFAANWSTLHQIPDGGLTNQVLTKLSSNNQDVAWMNPGGGVSQASLRKMDFKTSMYFKASTDGYTNLLLEQFIGLDGVSTLDRANVLEYYSTIEAMIENISQSDLVFRLVENTFEEPINYMEVEGDYTGTVTFEYSINGGESYDNFPEDNMLLVTTSSLILRITMEPGSTLNNVAIFVK